jgi:hypothetical protein
MPNARCQMPDAKARLSIAVTFLILVIYRSKLILLIGKRVTRVR